MYYTDDLLVEKYRPKNFDEYIIHNELFANIISMVKTDPFKLSNMIFESPSPGTGKSTFAQIIQNELHGDDDTDCIYVNGSGDGGIDTIRTKITEFVKTAPTQKDKPKLVIFEEADGLSSQAQNSLKVVFEKYLGNSRIIFTTNNLGKINLALKSRSSIVHFSEPSREDVFNRIKYIVDKEKIQLGIDKIDSIIDTFYPDIREMVKTLDEFVTFGTISLEVNREVATELWKEFKTTNSKTMLLDLITNRDMNHLAIVKLLFDFMIKDTKMTIDTKAKMSYLFLDFASQLGRGVQPEIVFVANVFKLSEFFDGVL